MNKEGILQLSLAMLPPRNELLMLPSGISTGRVNVEFPNKIVGTGAPRVDITVSMRQSDAMSGVMWTI